MYDAQRQHLELHALKVILSPGELIFHEDFAENFQVKHQDEVKQAYWSSDSVTAFTAIVYYCSSENSKLEHQSFAIISDELAHDKHSVFNFNKVILDTMGPKLP